MNKVEVEVTKHNHELHDRPWKPRSRKWYEFMNSKNQCPVCQEPLKFQTVKGD